MVILEKGSGEKGPGERGSGDPVPPADEARAAEFSIAEFLSAEQQKDLLRFTTAGSVDDGKSTLIGRLLYDSRNVYEDHVRAVTTMSPVRGQSSIDFAQLTDGLRAEREQGITIDVAYRYFSTERRKFIIADTPGHEQYTRNMATGASTADLAIILIDARKGILTQSRRHAYIASLLGIRHLVAAINKMDLVDFSAEVFTRIEEDFRTLIQDLGNAELQAIPVSALEGDNVVEPSSRMPWYSGPTLLSYLEAVPAGHESNFSAFRLPVQRVIRPNQHFRGFSGQIAAGRIEPGDRVIALPSGHTTRVVSISTFDGDLDHASAPQSITLTLEDELDISRGDLIASAEAPPQSSDFFEASLVWFDNRPLDRSRSYLLKHATQTVQAKVVTIQHRVNMQTMARDPVDDLAMNDIAMVEIETSRPIFFDSYQANRATGNFILIDAESNATAAAGMIRRALDKAEEATEPGEAAFLHAWSNKPAVVVLHDPILAVALEDRLLASGCAVVRTKLASPAIWQALLGEGVILIAEASAPRSGEAQADFEAQLGTIPYPGAELKLEALPAISARHTPAAVAQLVSELQRKQILIPALKPGTREGHA